MGRVTFREDRAGIDQMMASPSLVKEMERRAKLIKKRAEEIAPERTGRYRWGVVRINEGGRVKLARRRRKSAPGGAGTQKTGGGFTGDGFYVKSGVRRGVAYAICGNDTPYAYFLEKGTRYMKAQRIMGRAMDAAAG